MEEGSVSWETFSECIRDIEALSDRLDDGWMIRGRTDIPNGKYICKRITKPLPNSQSCTIEYHVVYDLSYAVPKLCLNAYRNDGTTMSLDECKKIFNIDETIALTVLTQMDHPVYQKPFLTLHPCKTGDMIGNYFTKSKNPVVSWLSAVGPILDLHLSNQYIDLTTTTTTKDE